MSTQFLAFLGIAAVVICVPGPDTALTIRNALAGHRRCGVSTAAGVATGQLAWTVAASLGIAGLILASAPAFGAVRWAGAAYLIFLGLRSLWSAVRPPGSRARRAPDQTRPVSAQLTPGRAFRQGLLSNLANPKMAAFFLSLLPQFVPAGPGSLAWSLLLGAV
ncbi:MAG TPA: LysE family translocator, partial [Propionibacteriaceae bacterium]|nr:LysE family translocator [Propionibacteriaceae bacterium]